EPVLLRRQVRKRMPARAKDVMLEERLPRLALREGALRDGDHGEQHAGVGRIGTCAEGVPPVVDEPVERRQRLHLVPPELRQIERISRLELHPERLLANLLETGEATLLRAVRRGGETDGSARHGVVDRADVELPNELRREEREPAPARDHTGDVLEGVVVTGDVRASAEPDARTDALPEERHRIAGGEARQRIARRHRAEVDRRRIGALQRLRHEVERIENPHHAPLEVESLELWAVVVLAFDRRAAEKGLHPGAGIERGEILPEARGGAARRLHHRPVGDEAAQDHGLTALDDLALEPIAVKVPAGDLLGGGSHDITPETAGGSEPMMLPWPGWAMMLAVS